MAMLFPSDDPKTNGGRLIRQELDVCRGYLKDREADLEKAKRHVGELTDTCARLRSKIEALERDEKALTRGYVAMMCDAAQEQ